MSEALAAELAQLRHEMVDAGRRRVRRAVTTILVGQGLTILLAAFVSYRIDLSVLQNRAEIARLSARQNNLIRTAGILNREMELTRQRHDLVLKHLHLLESRIILRERQGRG